MLKKHQELAELIGKAKTIATEIENEGGNTQTVIHHLRGAASLVEGRIRAYEEQAAADAAANKPAAETAKKKTAEADKKPLGTL